MLLDVSSLRNSKHAESVHCLLVLRRTWFFVVCAAPVHLFTDNPIDSSFVDDSQGSLPNSPDLRDLRSKDREVRLRFGG